MKVLVTGHRGRLGPVVCEHLESAGHTVRGFDTVDGDDILDAGAVESAAAGMDAAIHLAAIPDDRRRGAADAHVMHVNLLGTWNVLLAAKAARVSRVVFMSSGKSLGMLERAPAYLPLDDAHPGLPSGTYGLAKWLGEEMCQAFTNETGIPTVCLRPVAVLAPDEPPHPTRPGTPWHLGAWIDVRDVATATAAALSCGDVGHVRLLLSAADIGDGDDRPSRVLAREHYPSVPWRGGPEYEEDERRSLIDSGPAQRVLGWTPAHRWPDRLGHSSSQGTVERSTGTSPGSSSSG